MSTLAGETRLNRRDYALLSLFCAGLFGLGMLNGGELSWSEAVVPQTARTMLGDGDWMIPKRGRAPWLEGAPLAQWLTAAMWSLLGGEGRVWPMRLPSLLCSIGTVLLTASLATRWFGRACGLLSGLTLATASQFARQLATSKQSQRRRHQQRQWHDVSRSPRLPRKLAGGRERQPAEQTARATEPPRGQ